MNPILSKLRIYPIKSLDPLELKSVKIGVRSLLGDRQYAMLNLEGNFINGKRTGLVNQIKATFDEALNRVTFGIRENYQPTTFHLTEEVYKIEKYLSDIFEIKVRFLESKEGRFLDEPDISCATVIANETLKHLANELNDPIDILRLRFRTNIEISNVPPYWEEHLASLQTNDGVRFRIGEVNFTGVSLRARCNVPPRDPFTGATDKTFIKNMIASRQESIPAWSHVQQLKTLYHLSVDTFIPDSEIGKQINIGDSVTIL